MTREPATVNKALLWMACGVVFLTTGCLHPKVGPQSIPRDRGLYSASLADSWKEQTLLNIVKVRYLDPPVYVDIGNIVSSYSLSQGASLGGTVFNRDDNQLIAGAAVTFSNSPTITYTPLTGSAYIKGLTTPVPPQMVFASMQNGVPADTIFLATIQSINGIRNEQATLDGVTPADPTFHRVRELLREIQLSGAVRLYLREDASKQQTSIVRFQTTNLPPEILAASTEVRRLLHLDPEATEFKLVSSPLPSDSTELAVTTRSIIGILQNMAAAVEVPTEHLTQHRATPGAEAGKNLPGIVPMIRIHSGKNKPDDAFVEINYRTVWFWIDDRDLPSKRSFAQLMQLFTMVDTGNKENSPVVTIPSR